MAVMPLAKFGALAIRTLSKPWPAQSSDGVLCASLPRTMRCFAEVAQVRNLTSPPMNGKTPARAKRL